MKIHSGFLGNWRDAQPYVEEACHDVLEQDVMERYVKHAKTWAEAAKAGAADVE